MEAHRRRLREALRKRPEPGEGTCRTALVEAGHGSCDERLGILRREAHGRVVLPSRREPMAEPLELMCHDIKPCEFR